MKISPLSFNVKPAFKAVKSANKSVPNDVFGKKEVIYDVVSNEKDVDIWTLKTAKGGMFNPNLGYIVLIQDQKSGNILKEITGSSDELEQINKKVEDSMLWLKADQNYQVASVLKAGKAHQINPEDSDEYAEKLIRTAMSHESNSWHYRFSAI